MAIWDLFGILVLNYPESCQAHREWAETTEKEPLPLKAEGSTIPLLCTQLCGLWLLLLLGFLGLAATEYATKKLENWLVKHELVEDPDKIANLVERESQELDKSAAE